ncbi:MAG: penicillin-binding protein 2 [Anaerolineae bacterium]
MDSLMQRSLPRVRAVFAIIVVVLTVIGLQLVRLQVIKAAAAPVAEGHNQYGSLLPPHRGNMVDRAGNLLATDGVRYQVAIAGAITETTIMSLTQRLAPWLEMPPAELERRLRNHGQGVTVLKFYARQAAAAEIERWNTDYLRVERLARRFYPENTDAAFVLGLATADQIGRYGVEAKYDAFLRENGDMAVTNLENHLRALSPDFSLDIPSPVGRDLVLTIDRRIQAIVEDELKFAVDYYGATGGTIIVMDPKTGEILAMASAPGYSPNTFYEVQAAPDQHDPFSDPATGLLYEPGSVFKIVTMAAGLDSGKVTLDQKFKDVGVLEVGEREIRNSDRQAHGEVAIPTILQRSLNIGSAQVALAMGADTFYSYVERFGFGNVTGVDLSGEVRGIVKRPKSSAQWSPSDLATNAFGQGISVTPMQMICAVSAVANNGVMMRPHVVKAIVDHGRWFEIEPSPVRIAISPQTARLMTEILVSVVENGGTNQAAVPGYHIAGKTGTAEIPGRTAYDSDLTISTYVGYAPAADPRFVVLVKLDKTRLSVWAGHTSAPTFQRLARRLFALLNIPPSDG